MKITERERMDAGLLYICEGGNTVVGAGSVVTKDIPFNVVAVGNPCKVMREINERDYEYYFKDRKIDLRIK